LREGKSRTEIDRQRDGEVRDQKTGEELAKEAERGWENEGESAEKATGEKGDRNQAGQREEGG
jgi:hypothetical protein